jgi:hypothetical protein
VEELLASYGNDASTALLAAYLLLHLLSYAFRIHVLAVAVKGLFHDANDGP